MFKEFFVHDPQVVNCVTVILALSNHDARKRYRETYYKNEKTLPRGVKVWNA